METKVHSHHVVWGLLTVFVGIALYRANFLGVPVLVTNLTNTVLGAVAPITNSINVGQLTGAVTN